MIKKRFFWNNLFDWYTLYSRNWLPWRTADNPFHILTAEFLLQQTHVRAVEEVYCRLLELYPGPEKMAAADVSELQYIMHPLGLNYRAERLKRCAEAICRDYEGKVPWCREQLISLPGVGEYIADAVLCYAFGEPTVPIDTNVIRLFTRYFGLISTKARPRTDKVLAEEIRVLYSGFEKTRDANLAVLDFAAAVCSARKPTCFSCPLSIRCIYPINTKE